jgi:hypothetical protein
MFDHARQLLVVEVAEVEGREIEDVERDVEDALGQPLGDDSDD